MMEEDLVKGQLEVLAQTIASWIDASDDVVKNRFLKMDGREVELFFDALEGGSVTLKVGTQHLEYEVRKANNPASVIGFHDLISEDDPYAGGAASLVMPLTMDTYDLKGIAHWIKVFYLTRRITVPGRPGANTSNVIGKAVDIAYDLIRHPIWVRNALRTLRCLLRHPPKKTFLGGWLCALK